MTRRDDAAAPQTPEPVRGFYARLAEDAEMREAYAVEGLDEEVALLRSQLRVHVNKHPEDYELMLKSVGAIVSAVSARYRISDKRTKDLASTLASVLDAVGDQFT